MVEDIVVITKAIKYVAESLKRVPLLKAPIEDAMLQIKMFNYDKRNRLGWSNRRTTPADKHLDIYWNSENRPNRVNLVILISELLLENNRREDLSVLEFGSHVGINLKMISEAMVGKGITVDLYAVEPNEECFRFMAGKLRLAKALNSDDRGFVKDKDFPGKDIVVGLVNSVLYSLSYKSAFKVLEKMSKVCDVLVIGDEMANFDGNRSQFFNGKDHEGNEYRSLAHPFKKMLLKLGYKNNDLTRRDVPHVEKSITGLVIARKQTPS